MPRRRKALSLAPLAGTVIAFGGKVDSSLTRVVTENGGQVVSSVTDQTTHYVVAEPFDANAPRADKARKLQVHVVGTEWLRFCDRKRKRVDEEDFEDALNLARILAPAPSQPSPSQAPPAKKARTEKSPLKLEDPPPKLERLIKKGGGAMDEECEKFQTYHIYTDPDSGDVFETMLTYTDLAMNANKWYLLQLLARDTGPEEIYFYARWGRIGDSGSGSSKTKGPFTKDEAMKLFHKEFRSKTKVAWTKRRTEDIQPGKYSWKSLDRGHESDVEDSQAEVLSSEESDLEGATPSYKATLDVAISGSAGHPSPSGGRRMKKSSLPPETRHLLRVLFPEKFPEITKAELTFDANKLPLGKVKRSILLQALNTLSELEDALYQGAGAVELTRLSSEFYMLVPHAGSRSSPPPTIDEYERLEKAEDFLKSLLAMELDWLPMNKEIAESRMHPLDYEISQLNLKQLTPVDAASAEFSKLKAYSELRTGTAYMGYSEEAYSVKLIFRVERNGEEEAWKELMKKHKTRSHPDRRVLLWHGSQGKNWPSILKEGLRIAPHGPPCHGSSFGTGLYFSDGPFKAFSFTDAFAHGGQALMCLSEVQLGKHLLEYYGSMSVDSRIGTTHDSVIALGNHGPDTWGDAAEALGQADLAGVRMPSQPSEQRFEYPTWGFGSTQSALEAQEHPEFGTYQPSLVNCDRDEFVIYQPEQARLRYLVLFEKDHEEEASP